MFPFEEQAIKAHELNAARAKDGVYDEWVRKSFQALAELKPARYGKTEMTQDVVAQPRVSGAAPRAPCRLCGCSQCWRSCRPRRCRTPPTHRAGGTAARRARRRLPPATRRRPAPRPQALQPRQRRAATPAAGQHPEVPAAARADFQRAVNFMRAGNPTEAELGFKQLALQYPQFAAPLVNLAILQRKAGQLEEAEKSLKSAVDARERQRRRLDRARRHPAHARGVQGRSGFLRAGHRRRSALCARVAEPWRGLRSLSG